MAEAGCEFVAKKPLVSVIILNFNGSALTIQAAHSVLNHSQGIDIEIIVVDNGSDLGEVAMLGPGIPEAKLVLLDRNVFFGEGNNQGADCARGEFVLFLNNDTVVRKGWLRPLLDAFDDPTTGLAGSVFVDEYGYVLEAGSNISASGKSIQALRGTRFLDLPVSGNLAATYVSAACILMRKEIFDRINGFDYVYSPAYFEDVDLCLTIQSLGLKTIVSARSSVIHFENITSNKVLSRFERLILKRSNRQVFISRENTLYHSISPHTFSRNLPKTSLENEDKVTCLKISRLIHDEEIGFATLLLAKSLINSHHKVVISVPGRWSSFKLRRMGQTLGIGYVPVPVVAPHQENNDWNFVHIETILGVKAHTSLNQKSNIASRAKAKLPVDILAIEAASDHRLSIGRVVREFSNVGDLENILLSLSARPALGSLVGNLMRVWSLHRSARILGVLAVKVAIRPQPSAASRLNFLASTWLASRLGFENVVHHTNDAHFLGEKTVLLDGTRSVNWKIENEATNPWARIAADLGAHTFPIR